MIPLAPRLTEDEQRMLADEEERPLSREELEARIAAPWTAHEIEDFEALVTWFTTRYPTAGERLAAMRRRMDELLRTGAVVRRKRS